MPLGRELLLLFSIEDYQLAIDIGDLVQVSEGLKLTGNGGLEGALGYVDFQGEKLPLVDIKKRLDLEGVPGSNDNALVVRVAGVMLAFFVDSVAGVVEKSDNIIPFPQFVSKERDVISSICDNKGEFVLILNLKELLKDMAAADIVRV